MFNKNKNLRKKLIESISKHWYRHYCTVPNATKMHSYIEMDKLGFALLDVIGFDGVREINQNIYDELILDIQYSYYGFKEKRKSKYDLN